MGNRSWLYVQAAGAPVEIAEANNNFPTLWQLLLAGGTPGAAIGVQRVFGNAGTDNLQADADTAIARCRAMAALVATHPLLPRLPGLLEQFERLVTFLSQQVDAVRGEAGEPVHLSANLDEMSWLQSAAPADFIAQCRRECDERWAAAKAALQAGDHARFDAACGIRRFDDDAWQYDFGLGLMGFHGFDNDNDDEGDGEADESADIDDEAADEAEEADDDTLLPRGLQRWRDDAGRMGVRRRNGGLVVAAAWDAIDAADAQQPLFWVWQDDRAGLLRADGRSEQLLLVPQFSDAWAFEHGVAGVIPQDGEQIGLIGLDGHWLMPPSIDELWDFEHEAALARVGEGFGFIGTTGQWLVAPQLLEAEDFNDAGLAKARTADGWGLIRRDGHWAVAPAWDEATWEPTEYVGGSGLVQVIRGDRMGLLDESGGVLIPCEYGGLASVEPVSEDHDDGARTRWVGVMRYEGGAERHGAFDLAGGGERIPCRFDAVERFSWGEALGWLVAEPDTGLVGVLREDGDVLHPPVYAWIYSERESRPGFGSMHRALLGHAWRRGEGVMAHRAGEDTTMWLCADGRALSPANYAAERLAVGDLRAVLAHAESLRDGVGVPADDAAARRWFGRAAGLPDGADLADPSRAVPHGLGSAMHALATMLCDGTGGPADPAAARAWLALAISRAGDGECDVVAHALMGYLLAEGIGGPADAAAARHHYTLAADRGDTMALYNLGLMHLMGDGGPVDLAAAAERFRDAQARGHDNAGYQLGRVLAQQAQAAPDAATAAVLRREAAYFLRTVATQADHSLRPHACWVLGELAVADGDLAAARDWLTQAAEGAIDIDDVDGVRAASARLLADAVYGPAGSPLHDAAQAAHWQQVARPPGPPDLGEVLGAGGALVKGVLRRLLGH